MTRNVSCNTRNLAIANRSCVSCTHKVTVNFQNNCGTFMDASCNPATIISVTRGSFHGEDTYGTPMVAAASIKFTGGGGWFYRGVFSQGEPYGTPVFHCVDAASASVKFTDGIFSWGKKHLWHFWKCACTLCSQCNRKIAEFIYPTCTQHSRRG